MPFQKSTKPTKTSRIVMRLNEAEKTALSCAAVADGKHKSQWLLDKTCAVATPVLADPIDALVKSIDAFGSAYNQLARIKNNLAQTAGKRLFMHAHTELITPTFEEIAKADAACSAAATTISMLHTEFLTRLEELNGSRTASFFVRVLPSQKQLISARASERHLSTSHYLRAIIRTHGEYNPGFSRDALFASANRLFNTTLALSEAGKTLNQITHDINSYALMRDEETSFLIASSIASATNLYGKLSEIAESLNTQATNIARLKRSM